MKIIMFLAVSLVFPQDTSKNSTIDLSTPERTVRSFVSALNAGNFLQAARCVVGGKTNDPTLKGLQQKFREFPNYPLKILTLKVKRVGESTAEVTISTETSNPSVGKVKWSERLVLMKRGQKWQIRPSKDDDSRKRTPSDVSYLEAATVLVTNPQAFQGAQDKARQMICLANLRQITMAAHMHMQDHDEIITLKAASYSTQLKPYVRNLDEIFHCPVDKSGNVSYSFNKNLQNVKAENVREPSKTVMFYEGQGGQLEFRHEGKACVGFVDGHTKMVNREEAKKLRWKP